MTEELAAMPDQFKPVDSKLSRAVAAGRLMEPAATNIRALLIGASSDLYLRTVSELVDAGEWSELNDRFYQTLAFGTGGLRGRTIGRIVTTAERGNAQESDRPEFPCVGTNAMNYFNVSRATRGLVEYLRDWNAREKIPAKPKIAIAHDPRFFSEEFAELLAKVASESGCDAFVFEGPRSVPELSFAVRYLKAGAGVVITASHNPPHDNGFKAYFSDGAQVIEPHASQIIERVNDISSEPYTALLGDRRGTVTTIGKKIDDAYMDRLETLVLDPAVIHEAKLLKIIYSPLHGTGSVIIKPMLRRLGFNFKVVPEQDHFDGRFPTVKSPNPENAEALTMAIELAEQENADVVVATDPDCDRVGTAIRGNDGKMKLLTGNQIGSLIAWYRIRTLFKQGVLNNQNASRGVIIKTFVTTDLQKAIAAHFGLRCVETLTGFKYIGAKLGKYQRETVTALRNDPHLRLLPQEAKEDGIAPGERAEEYVDLSENETRKLRLKHSSFYVFGGEESYGYSGADFVRDKDGNGAAIMFCEMAAYAKTQGKTVEDLLDDIYCEFGYFAEKSGSLVFEGAEGAGKIAQLIRSYATNPFEEILGSEIVGIRNFETDDIKDVEGDRIPREKMLIFELRDGTRIAVRPSGTEPKIKYYLFAQRRPESGKFESAELNRIKTDVEEKLHRLWEWLQDDAQSRVTN